MDRSDLLHTRPAQEEVARPRGRELAEQAPQLAGVALPGSLDVVLVQRHYGGQAERPDDPADQPREGVHVVPRHGGWPDAR